MKIVISQKQHQFLQEQYFYPSYENAKYMQIAFEDLRKKPYGDTLISLGLWFVPYIGPYLSVSYSGLIAVKKIEQGKYVEGIIDLLTSPLVLMKTIKVLKIMGGSDDVVKMLQAINKTGITVMVSEGQSAFLKWGYKNFGANFVIFISLLSDKVKMKNLLSELKDPNTNPKKS